MKDGIARFTDGEYARRYRVVREEMEKRDLDCLLIPVSENIVYLANISYQFLACYLLLPRHGEPTVFLDNLANYRSKQDRFNNGPLPPGSGYWAGESSISIENASVMEDLRGVGVPDMPREIAAWLKERNLARSRIGVVGREILWASLCGGSLVGTTGPMGLNPLFYRELTKLVPHADFLDGTSVLVHARIIKSQEEVESVTNATRVADRAGEAIAREMRKSGVKEGDLFAAYFDTLYRAGGGMSWYFMAWTTSTADPQDVGGHLMPYDYTLQEGDLFIAELCPESREGYAGHLDVSFVLGEPVMKDAYDRVNEICMESHDGVIESLKPGATEEEILNAGDDPLRRAGLMRGAPLLYSIGVYGMEPLFVGVTELGWAWPESMTLEKNMTVNIISHVYDQKTNVCVRTGSAHVITENGSQCLNDTAFPRGLVCLT